MKPAFHVAWIIGVLFVLAGLALLLTPSVDKGPYPRAREAIAELWIRQNTKTALIRYQIDCGRFPTTDEGLNALIQAPAEQSAWKGPYLEGARGPLDSWGRPYRYRSPAVKSSAHYDLWSEAGDVLSDKDDIVSWQQ